MAHADRFLTQHPRWAVTAAWLVAALVWAASILSITSQVGKPFPGFFYTPDRIVSSFTRESFTGWQAGLRPWDRIVAVNGRPAGDMPRLVSEAKVGSTLVYTVARAGRQAQVHVPTMLFTADLLAPFIPGWLLFAILCMAVGGYAFSRNPPGRLNRYLLLYLLLWASAMGAVWEYFLSQIKWTAWLIHPWIGIICVAGWVFFWSFPADQSRRRFLRSWPLIPAFVVLAAAATLVFSALLLAASLTDELAWWSLYTVSVSWVSFVVFGGGSIVNKTLPLVLISARRGAIPAVRWQAVALLTGIGVGLSGLLVLTWAPVAVHWTAPVDPQWGGVVACAYPLAIGYAVMRYQLLNIRFVLRKGMVYSVLTAALTGVFLVLSILAGYVVQESTGRQSLMAALVPALVVAVLFHPLRSRIQTLVDRAFFRGEYEARQTLLAFSRSLSTLRERGEVARLVVFTVMEAFGAATAEVWLLDQDSSEFCAADPLRATALSAGSELARLLTGQARPYLPGADDPPAQLADLHSLGAVLAVPIMIGDTLDGILTLGEKRSGGLYSQSDLDLLATLSQSAALALDNALLHEEQMADLRRHVTQITAAQEEERQRFARELHDGMGPALASLNLRLRASGRMLEREGHPVAKELGEMAELTQDSVREIRRLIHDLRPNALDDLGLVPALKEYLSRCEQESGLAIRFTVEAGDRMPARVETALFRIVQEAINNAIKHAEAHRVDVDLSSQDRTAALRIADDGRGFDPSRTPTGSHVGLWSMQERVRQLGGQFRLQSSPGGGTVVSVAVPLGQEAT